MTFAGGCFWCKEPPFDELDGVISTTSGYTGGSTRNPTYEQVSAGRTGHTEAIQIVYDPSRVTYASLLQVFWRNVDAGDGAGQFCDRGPQYRPGIFHHPADQQTAAEASRERFATQLAKSIRVHVVAATEFYQAESYHQDDYKKNPVRYKFYRWNCGREQRLSAGGARCRRRERSSAGRTHRMRTRGRHDSGAHRRRRRLLHHRTTAAVYFGINTVSTTWMTPLDW